MRHLVPICAVCFYGAINVLLGLYIHMRTRGDSDLTPKPGELLLYFLVVTLLGLPIALVITFTGLVTGLMHKDPLA